MVLQPMWKSQRCTLTTTVSAAAYALSEAPSSSGGYANHHKFVIKAPAISNSADGKCQKLQTQTRLC